MPGKIADKILAGAREAAAYAKGEAVNVRIQHFGPDVKRVRNKLGMTQSEFAETFVFSLDAIKHWETGRRVPERAAQTLLKVIEQNPNSVLGALGKPVITVVNATSRGESVFHPFQIQSEGVTYLSAAMPVTMVRQ